MRFCELYRNWTPEQWIKVLYSDESTFRVSVPHGGHLVRRPPGSDRFDRRYTVRRQRIAEGVCVWGSFSGDGKTPLTILPPKTMMKTDLYITVLRDRVVPGMANLECTHYLQDKAPCHTSRLSTAFIRVTTLNLLSCQVF